MAVIKCKMCGGDLVFEEGATVCECEYCGSKQTIPTADNEKKMTLFARANRLRFNSEFDKAFGVYESIVAEFPEEAEAYWGLILCKYGIEYVDDPATGKKVPTCHRSSFESVMDDPNYELTMEYADAVAKKVYRAEAKALEELRKGIVEISGKEAPYDIFICYKETDPNGERTLDSVIAQDVYTALTEKGYRVFFSRISLEDKLGMEYEPYIFAALHSARVMLAFGTDPDYYDAVWVKNEWSRYLKLIAAGEKKTLIPCYKGLDAYDMPKEFARLQAQDMGKVGAVQDLLRGIDKITGKSEEEKPQQTAPVVPQTANGPSAASLVERGYYSIEDYAFDEARDYFNRALDIDPKSAESYLGLYMVELNVKSRSEARVAFIETDTEQSRFFTRAMQFATGYLAEELKEWESAKGERLKREEQKMLQRKKEQEDAGRELESILKELRSGSLEPSPEERAEQSELKRLENAKDAAVLAFKLAKFGMSVEHKRQIITEIEKQIAEQKQKLKTLNIFKSKEKRDIEGKIIRLQEDCETIKFELDNYLKLQLKTEQAEAELEAYVSEHDGKHFKEITEKKQTLLKRAEELRQQFPGIELLCAGKGDLVSFGRYPTEKNGDIQAIEWAILDKIGSRLLLISESAVDCKPYNAENISITWESCSLRKWLNNEFISTAFNENERGMLVNSEITADGNPQYKTNPGAATNDMVFLPSISEMKAYFPSDGDRQCVATPYAFGKGISINERYTVHGKFACCWWLRTPGYYENDASYVDYIGSISTRGNRVDINYRGVRPAMWIDLSKLGD